jgi:cyclopropane fatty-acyl-phospholipid synthase-like methyltransferase
MIKELIANQFRRPRGILGLIAAGMMKTPNQEPYDKIIELLDVRNGDQLLEIGCGPGRGIKQIVDKKTDCKIDAIDFSMLMVKKAASNNKTAVDEKRVTLIYGDFTEYDFKDRRYSKIFAINVIYFWKELKPVFNKLFNLLKSGGRLHLYMSSPELLRKIPFAVDAVFNKYTLDNVMKELTEAGFTNVDNQAIVKNGFQSYYISTKKQQKTQLARS